VDAALRRARAALLHLNRLLAGLIMSAGYHPKAVTRLPLQDIELNLDLIETIRADGVSNGSSPVRTTMLGSSWVFQVGAHGYQVNIIYKRLIDDVLCACVTIYMLCTCECDTSRKFSFSAQPMEYVIILDDNVSVLACERARDALF
jgi:hypothetical protein